MSSSLNPDITHPASVSSEKKSKDPPSWADVERRSLVDLEYFYKTHSIQEIPTYKEIKLESHEKGKISIFWLELLTNALGAPVCIPIMIARGSKPGPTLGLCAAMHGNELNGMPTIQHIFHDLSRKVGDMSGAIIACPLVNVYGYQLLKRYYLDDVDLNRTMPGKKDGRISEQFAYQFFHKFVKKLDYLIDLHTASFGHLNSYYIRVDLTNKVCARMAELMRADIILNNSGDDGTLRAVACAAGIPTICCELGDPQSLDKELIRRAYVGIWNVLFDFGLLPHCDDMKSETGSHELSYPPAVTCRKSSWLYTKHGGVLTVFPKLKQRVKKGDPMAMITDVFGFVVAKYEIPEDGIVIGKQENPSNHQGDRIIHLGIIGTVKSSL